MKRFFLSCSLVLISIAAFSTTHTITNSGFAFSPSTITINLGDDINFVLEAMHNVVEVSQATWNANGNSALSGGFQTAFGGGAVPSSKLGAGTHYYVCSPHSSSGMKGIIIVQNTTGIEELKQLPEIIVYPVPSASLLTIRSNIKLSGLQFLITNLTGEVVSTGHLNDIVTPVDISQLSPGIYFVRTAGQRKQSVRFVKN
jgi:plastocyanin